jgi:hypothetical protein
MRFTTKCIAAALHATPMQQAQGLLFVVVAP